MDTRHAEKLAKDKLKEFGLSDWAFEFDRAKRRFGACHYRKKKITLSRPLTRLNKTEEVVDTILHEIAHALSPTDRGHGGAWKNACALTGARPRRCYGAEVTKVRPNHIYQCVGCQIRINRFKKVPTKAYHAKCGIVKGQLQRVGGKD